MIAVDITAFLLFNLQMWIANMNDCIHFHIIFVHNFTLLIHSHLFIIYYYFIQSVVMLAFIHIIYYSLYPFIIM